MKHKPPKRLPLVFETIQREGIIETQAAEIDGAGILIRMVTLDPAAPFAMSIAFIPMDIGQMNDFWHDYGAKK